MNVGAPLPARRVGVAGADVLGLQALELLLGAEFVGLGAALVSIGRGFEGRGGGLCLTIVAAGGRVSGNPG